MSAVGEVIATVLWIFFIILLARFVIDLIQMLARQWKPSGPMLLVCEVVYTITDPPLKALRKIIPPLRLGGVALDLSFLVLVIALQIAIQLVLLL